MSPGAQRMDQGSRVKADSSGGVGQIQGQLWNQAAKENIRLPSGGSNASGKFDGRLFILVQTNWDLQSVNEEYSCLLTCLLTYLLVYLLTYLFTYLLVYLLSCLLSYLLVYLLIQFLYQGQTNMYCFLCCSIV